MSLPVRGSKPRQSVRDAEGQHSTDEPEEPQLPAGRKTPRHSVRDEKRGSVAKSEGRQSLFDSIALKPFYEGRMHQEKTETDNGQGGRSSERSPHQQTHDHRTRLLKDHL